MKHIKVDLKDGACDIYVGYGLWKSLARRLRGLNAGNFALIVTSRTVNRLYRRHIPRAFAGCDHALIILPDGEGAKSTACFTQIVKALLKHDRWYRKIFIVCLGGGTISDAAGFAASAYKRGVPYVNVPTTLLAQIDAAIGGKTAVDMAQAKNILGAFYQPRAVFIDPIFLNTLSRHQIREGLAEVIKYAAIADRDFFSFLTKNSAAILALERAPLMRVITTCAALKAAIVTVDPWEKKGKRTILNFGHTFGHALETSLGYKKIAHGEAVAIGMIYAAQLSLAMRRCRPDDVQALTDIIRQFGLPLKTACKYSTIMKAMAYDKKFISRQIRMVLLRRIGKAMVINAIPRPLVEESTKHFCGQKTN